MFTLTQIAFHKVKEVGSEGLSSLDVFEYLSHVECLAVRGTVLLNVGPLGGDGAEVRNWALGRLSHGRSTLAAMATGYSTRICFLMAV